MFSRRGHQKYEIVECPSEVLLGDTLEVVVNVRGHVGPLDWLGVYPEQVPSLPGLSHGRWKYLSSGEVVSRRGSGDSLLTSIRIRLSPSSLPNHSGVFEVRVHPDNQYGVPISRSRIHICDAPMWPLGRFLLCCIFLFLVWCAQQLLNAKGSCPFVSPLNPHTPDVIRDLLSIWTSPLNEALLLNPQLAHLVQAISSFLLDAGVLLLCALSSTRRSSCRSFIALFFFFALRTIAQLAATIPCPPGFLWPDGRIMDVPIPTLFVDYHNANDFFFSGHSGTAMTIALELFHLDYHRSAAFYAFIVFPYVSIAVVSFRVHRGIDVLAAMLASVTACALAKEIAEPLDRALQIRRTQQRRNEKEKS